MSYRKNLKPLVSIVIPCRNEAAYIEGVLHSVLKQELPSAQFEIIVADGMSDDGTREIISKLAKEDTRIRLVDNPERITSCALNHAIHTARGDIVVRMDAHTEYALDYIKQCVAILQETGAGNVGGAWRAVGKSYIQQAIALSFQSSFSCGGASSHSLEYEGEMDSVYLGCWKKSTLERIGLFDEELVRNQDDELNLRLIKAGYKIWQSPRIKSWYYPRASIRALFKQYVQYGYWKVKVIQKHKIPASLRHIIPGSFTGILILIVFLSPLSILFVWLFLGLIGFYSLVNILATIITCSELLSFKFLPVMPLIFAAYHFGYGYGFIRGIIDFVIFRQKKVNHNLTKITRDFNV